MKYQLPYIINLPPFMFRGENTDEFSTLKKIFFILKGKFLSFMISRLNGKNFCRLLNVVYGKESNIYYEEGKYKKHLKNTGVISYPNKRILRMVNNYEIQLEKLLQTYCIDEIQISNRDVVIDCGSNVGELNIALMNKNIFVNYIAFEPDPDTFECLIMNNSDERNTFYKNTLSNKSGEEEFFLDNDGGNSSLSQFGQKDSMKVNSLTLDSLEIKMRVRLLKIDAEGYEPEVIEGGINTLKKIEYISVDYGHEKGSDEESTIVQVNKILYDNGFELVKFSDYRLIGLYENKRLQ